MTKIEKKPKTRKKSYCLCPILQIQQVWKDNLPTLTVLKQVYICVPDILMTLQIHDKVPKIPDFSSKLDCRKNDKKLGWNISKSVATGFENGSDYSLIKVVSKFDSYRPTHYSVAYTHSKFYAVWNANFTKVQF